MKFGNIEKDFSLLYENAKNSFKECIRNKDNAFLVEEVNISLNEIVIKEKDIKIVFHKRDFTKQTFEVSLLLFDRSLEIGKYLYVENEVKQAVDDSLVFY